MKNDKNIRYAIVTLNGFIMDEHTGGMKLFFNAEEARPYMNPGNAIVPIRNEEEQGEYESGKKRLPTVNRFGRGKQQVLNGPTK